MTAATASISPDGVWFKTHFYRQGPMLHMVTYSCIAGNPEVFKASVDLRPILKRVVQAHARLHQDGKVSGSPRDLLVGFSFNPFKAIGNLAKSAASMVNKIGKTKLISSIGASVKSVVKSKFTGAILAGAAIVFPPVGLPAVAAYAMANKALTSIDQAKAAVHAATELSHGRLDPALTGALRDRMNQWSGGVVAMAREEGIKLPTQYKSQLAQAVKITKDRAEQAKHVIREVNRHAKSGNVEAQKMARVFTLAHNAREQLKHVAATHVPSRPGGYAPSKKPLAKIKSKGPAVLNGFPAVLITNTGKVVPGRYMEKKSGHEAVVLRGGKVYRGKFAAVSGVFGPQEIIGCSNPFRLPAAAR